MPPPTHRTTASVLRLRRTSHAQPARARMPLTGAGKAVHDYRSVGIGRHSTPRLRPLPHPNELSRELGWVQRGGGCKKSVLDYGCDPTNRNAGHMAFYLKTLRNGYQMLGGNQSNKVCVAGYWARRALGYRWVE